MECVGDRLTVGKVLRPGEYLTSKNGLYFAIMQSDGNFVVYHGKDPSAQSGACFATETAGQNPAFMVMQGDGNLCIYQGTPENRGGFIWGLNNKNKIQFDDSTNKDSVAVMQNDGNFVVYSQQENGKVIWGYDRPPAVSRVEANVNYDLNARTTVDVNDPDQVPLVVDNYNATDTAQTRTLDFSRSYTKTSSWSASDSITVGVSVEFSIVPVLDEGSVTLSVSATHTYTWGKTESETNNITATIPVEAGAYEDVICSAMLQKRNFVIPYSGTAIFHYQDGSVVPGNISGNYTGTSYYLMSHTSSNPIHQ